MVSISNPELLYEHVMIKYAEYTRESAYTSKSATKTYNYQTIDLRFYYGYSRFFRATISPNTWKNLKLKLLFSKVKIESLDESTYIVHVKDIPEILKVYSEVTKKGSTYNRMMNRFREVYEKEEYVKKRDLYGIKRAEGI